MRVKMGLTFDWLGEGSLSTCFGTDITRQKILSALGSERIDHWDEGTPNPRNTTWDCGQLLSHGHIDWSVIFFARGTRYAGVHS